MDTKAATATTHFPNAAYTYDFAAFLQHYGAALCVSLASGQHLVAPLMGLRIDFTFGGFNHRPEMHYGVRRLDLNHAADVELARAFWNRARRWAADNDKRMPLALYPYAAA